MKTLPKTFEDVLASLTAAELRALLRARAATLAAPPRARDRAGLIKALASLLADPQSILEALEQTDLAQMEVLVYVLAHGRSAARAAMEAEAGPDRAARLDEALAGLAALGLLGLHERGGQRYAVAPAEVAQRILLPVPLRYPVAAMVAALDARVLARICETLGIANGDPMRPAPLRDELARRLSDPDFVVRTHEMLPPDAARFVRTMLKRGGQLEWYQVLSGVERRHRTQLEAFDWARTWPLGKPRNPVECVIAHGLCLPVDQFRSPLVMPGEVWRILSERPWFGPGLDGPPAWESRPAGPADVSASAAILRDVACFLAFVDRGETQRTSRGLMHRVALKTVAKQLTIGRVEYAEFVYATCREMGMIRAEGPGTVYTVEPQAGEWMAQPAAEQYRSLIAAWLSQSHWREAHPDPLSEYHGYASVAARKHRQRVIDGLRAACRALGDDAVSVQSLSARVWYNSWTVASDHPDVPHAADGRMDLVRAIACQSMYWLGLVECVPAAEDCTHVRLSRLGRAALMGEDDAGAVLQRTPAFVVQPNLEIFAPPNLETAVFYRLCQSAQGSPNGVLTMTRDSLRRAFDRGETAAGLLKFVGEHSSTGVPQPVRYLLEEVGARHGHIRLGHAGLYLHVDDPVLLKEIELDKRLGIRVREKLSDTVALITGDSLDHVLRDLRAAGYFPVAGSDRTRAASSPSRPQSTPHAPRPRVALAPDEVDARIDWNRIAQEDPRGSA